MKKVLPVVMVFMLASCLVAQEKKDVILHDGEWRERVSTDARQQGAKYREKAISVDTGVVQYGIRAMSAVMPDGKGIVPAEGYLGMTQPSSENWYGGGFMGMKLNDKDIGSAPIKDMRVVEKGERGAFDVIWDAPEATVRVRFLAMAGDNKLFCEIALEPKTELKSVNLRTICYPSFFTAWHKQNGHRVVQSLASKAEEGQTFKIDPQKDWALIYYDTVFDFAVGRGVGPCASLFLPEQIKSGEIRIGNYGVPSEFVIAPGAKTIRMIFWDFKGKSNQDAISCITGQADAFEKELRQISFVNRTVTAFDFAKQKAETDALIASAKGTEELAKKLGEIDAKLGPICQRAREAVASGQSIPFALEDEAIKLLTAREEIYWKLKFHVLLND